MHWHLLLFHDKDMQKAVQDTTRSYKVSVTVCTCTPFECFQLNHAQWQPLQSQFHHKWPHQWQLWCFTSIMTTNCTVWKFGFFQKLLLFIVYHFMWKTYIMCLYVLFLKYFEKNNIQVSWTYTRMLGVTFKNTASLLLHKRQLFPRVHKLSCIIIMCVEAMFIEEVLGYLLYIFNL